ncbi:MAG: hypothetical protein ACT4NU_02270 [Chromatiales bacterium]
MTIGYAVADFLTSDHALVARLMGAHVKAGEEHVLVRQDDDTLDLAVYLDAGLLQRLLGNELYYFYRLPRPEKLRHIDRAAAL